MTDEMYVRSVWKGASYFGFSGGVGGYITTDDLALSDSQISSIAAWADAAGFTRQRLEQIRQVEEEIRICDGCLRFWQEPLGTEYGGVVPMRRILSREQAALVELKRGMNGGYAVTDEEKRDVARDEFDNCCCNYAIDLHEKVDALTKDLDVATRESDEVIKILGALAPGGSIVNMAIAAHTAIGSLKEQRDAAKAENAKLENRHVQFMVEGGPVVMVADYDKLKAENDRLRAALDKATGPVTEVIFRNTSPEEVAAAIAETEYKYFGDYEFSEGQRDAVNTLTTLAQNALATRKEQGNG